MVARLPEELSAQALASYEAGTRSCTVVRFVELCGALDASPHDVLGRVTEAMHAEGQPSSLKVDLSALAADDRVELSPARRWAQTELAHRAGPTRELDIAALESLAALCGLPVLELIRELREH